MSLPSLFHYSATHFLVIGLFVALPRSFFECLYFLEPRISESSRIAIWLLNALFGIAFSKGQFPYKNEVAQIPDIMANSMFRIQRVSRRCLTH